MLENLHISFIFSNFVNKLIGMEKISNKTKQALRTIRGTIVEAGHIQDFTTTRGKRQQSAMLHIQEDENNPDSPHLAVKVSGDLCNYVGCVGAHVVVEYMVRVFGFVKNGIKSLGNDVYATSVRMV